MKKTIAKIMAAAVMLSSVPAVALPSLTAEAGYIDATGGTMASFSSIEISQGSTVVSSVTNKSNSYGSSNAGLTVKTDNVTRDASDGNKLSQITTDLKVSAVFAATASYATGKAAGKDTLENATTTSSNIQDVTLDSNYLTQAVSMTVNDVATPSNARAYITGTGINDDGYITLNISSSEKAQAAFENASETNPVIVGLKFSKGSVVDNIIKKGSGTAAATAYDDKDLAWGTSGDDWLLYLKIVSSTADSSTASGNGKITTDDSSVNIPVKVTYNTGDKTCEVEATEETTKVITSDEVKGLTLMMNEITNGGVDYKVVKIHSQAFKNGKFKAVQAKNVKHINQGAFRKCKRMKKINLGDNRKLRKIHSKVFYDDKKLATIKLDGRNLKEVGSKAFQGVKKNCTIKVKAKNKSNYNSAVKKLKKGVGSTKVKFARI